MTIDKEEVASAGLLKKRIEAKRRRAALESELRIAGKSLYEVGGALRNASCGSMGGRVDHILPMLAAVPAICDLGRVRILLEELKELESLLDQLNYSASQLGID